MNRRNDKKPHPLGWGATNSLKNNIFSCTIATSREELPCKLKARNRAKSKERLQEKQGSPDHPLKCIQGFFRDPPTSPYLCGPELSGPDRPVDRLFTESEPARDLLGGEIIFFFGHYPHAPKSPHRVTHGSKVFEYIPKWEPSSKPICTPSNHPTNFITVRITTSKNSILIIVSNVSHFMISRPPPRSTHHRPGA